MLYLYHLKFFCEFQEYFSLFCTNHCVAPSKTLQSSVLGCAVPCLGPIWDQLRGEAFSLEPVVGQRQLTKTCETPLYASLSNSEFSEVKTIVSNLPGQRYLHPGNQQIQQIKFFPHQESQTLNIDQHTTSQSSPITLLHGWEMVTLQHLPGIRRRKPQVGHGWVNSVVCVLDDFVGQRPSCKPQTAQLFTYMREKDKLVSFLNYSIVGSFFNSSLSCTHLIQPAYFLPVYYCSTLPYLPPPQVQNETIHTRCIYSYPL